MAIEIKLFNSVQKYNQIAGIHLSQPNQRYSFDFKSAAILLFYFLTFISATAYFIFKAKTITEYVQCFYVSLSMLCISIAFTSMCWKMRDILYLIEEFKEFIQKSEFKYLWNL